MRPALKVVSAQDPARAALAVAIANAAPVQAEVEEALALAQSGRNALEEAIGAVPAAERAVAEAKARLIDNPAGDRSELRRLRQAVTDATDDLEIAREVAARTDLRFKDAERSAHYATERVEAAANRVIVANYASALEAADRAGREFARLAFIAGIIAASGDPLNGERTQLVGRVDMLNPHFVYRGDGSATTAARQAAQAPWLAARAALLTDADAPLPELEP